MDAGQPGEPARDSLRVTTRRHVLCGLAALGSSAFSIAGSATTRQRGQNGLIDVHHHIFPPDYMTEVRQRLVDQYQGPLPSGVSGWSPARAIADMDLHGIAKAIVSISTPGVWFGDALQARRLARLCNDYSAALVREHPSRFGFFASLPLPDRDGSLSEIAHAFDALGTDGVCLLTSYGNQWLGDPGFADVFEELNRRAAVVYVHPTGPNCCRQLIPWVPYVATELPHDTTRAITSLIYSGATARWPQIRFVFSHAGGTFPMLAGRIGRAAGLRPEIAKRLPNGFEAEVARLHFEIGATANAPALAALRALVPMRRILFGTDYPYAPMELSTGGFQRLLPAAVQSVVGFENARRLIG